MGTDQLFDTSVAMGRSDGLITVFTVVEFPPAAKRPFEIVYPETMDYVKAIVIADSLRKIGRPAGAIDTIIAAICVNRSLELVTKDTGFKSIKEVVPELSLCIVG